MDGNMDGIQPRALPIGVSSFSDMIRKGYCYVDKTWFIQQLLNTHSHTIMVTRPRGFGKTLNLDMLRCFFDCNSKNENRSLFNGLAISQHEQSMAEQGKYPVIYLGLRDVVGNTLQQYEISIRHTLRQAYSQHRYLLKSHTLSKEDKEQLKPIFSRCVTIATLATSLKTMINMLAKHHGKPVVVLVDDYDTPGIVALKNNITLEVDAFLRQLLSALIGNDKLRIAVITGITRLDTSNTTTCLNFGGSKPSVNFTNNRYFGFTERDVERLAAEFNRQDKLAEISDYYGGYIFDNQSYYNPWAIMNYFYNDCQPSGYWTDIVGNEFIDDFLRQLEERYPDSVTSLFYDKYADRLFASAASENKCNAASENKRNTASENKCNASAKNKGNATPNNKRDCHGIHSHLIQLAEAGYLTPQQNTKWLEYSFKIPNQEILNVFGDWLLKEYERKLGCSSLHELGTNMSTKDHLLFAKRLEDVLVHAIRFFHNQEAVYRGFTLLLLVCLNKKYELLYNREADRSHSVILLQPLKNTQLSTLMERPGLVFALRQCNDSDNLQEIAYSVLQQIAENRYPALFPDQVNAVHCYGIAFREQEAAISCNCVPRHKHEA